MKGRIVVAFIVILLDIFILPLLLQVPVLAHDYGGLPQGLSAWKESVTNHPFTGPGLILNTGIVQDVWLKSQILVFTIMLCVFFAGGGLLKGKGPMAAGNGQFGTSRWQTEKEIDENFTRGTVKESDLDD